MQAEDDREVGEEGSLRAPQGRLLASVAAGVAAVIYAAASSVAADKAPPPAKPQVPQDDPPRPRILYHEETGGPITPIAPPQGPGKEGRGVQPPPSSPPPAGVRMVPTPPPQAAPATSTTTKSDSAAKSRALPSSAAPAGPVKAAPKPPPETAPKAVPKPAAKPVPRTASPAPAPAAKPVDAPAAVAAWSCERPGAAWSQADESRAQGRSDRAFEILDALARCDADAVRIEALERARLLLDGGLFKAWLDREAPRRRGPDAERRFQQLAYQGAIERSREAGGTSLERARRLDAEAASGIVAYRDAPVATALGWLWLEAGDGASAGLWFQRARTWQPDSTEALRGLALAALKERDFERALAHADALPPAAEGRTDMRREALLGLAQRDFQLERYADALARFAEAEKTGALPRYARMQRAWSQARAGERDDASRSFAELYREHRDLESAQGLLASANGATRIDASLAATEPLASLLRARLAEAAFNARRFVEARGLDPERYGAVGAISATQVALGAGYRDKSGERGLSKLRADMAPVVEAGLALGDRAVLRASYERVELDAGAPAAGAIIGSGILSAEGARIRSSIDEARIGVRYEHGWILQAAIGRGPNGGELAARTLGSVELALAPAWGQASIAASSAPVRESVLSYSGLRDPLGEVAWGRVFRHSLEGRALWLTRSPWSAGVRARLARLEGEGVRDNRQETFEVSLGYDLRLPGFSYAAVSVGAGLDEYRHNLSHFTLGHGGYFSPQRYRRVGAAFDFMTAEDRAWMARGRLAAGRIEKREAESPFFPLAPDGPFYEGSSDRGHDATAQLALVAQVHPYVQLGFAVARGLSPQYRETQAFLQVRVLFEPRRSVVSADLPAIRNE